MLNLQSRRTKLEQIHILDFCGLQVLEFNFADLINLRQIFCWSHLKLPNIGRLISFQTLPDFTIRDEQGYEVKQPRDLNKLHDRLQINSLKNVKNKEEGVQANLAAKERLTELTLSWENADTRCSPEVEAKVLVPFPGA